MGADGRRGFRVRRSSGMRSLEWQPPIRSAQREELADLELGDVLGKRSIAEISRVNAADSAWHGDSPPLRRSGSVPGILLWAPEPVRLAA